ncbi:DUF732 domain-containing protein [Leifsonia sp. Leaf264]|uniref:DUF732 domain-containing protein n=1 Tax=Leifsonia sp. Leaf264 TaxID=1736314 RepID=UPI0006F92A2E|nr:DUF732 domain-containing protein [Leifsonia sp. Leaf264]KQO98822.1 hypothetical protein ASF30_12225 [Leifsonia sp. Leaf264]
MRKPILAFAAAAAIVLSLAGCSNDGALVDEMRSTGLNIDGLTDEQLASITHSGCDRVEHSDSYSGWAEQVYAENPAALSAEGAKNVATLGMQTACPDKLDQLDQLG